MSSTTAPVHHVLLFDGFDELDAVGPFEVLAAAGLPTRTVGLPGADPTVRGGNGMTFRVDGPLPGPGAEAPAVLVVPGGGLTTGRPGVGALRDDPDVLRTLADLHAGGTTMASVCTGAILLGAAGLLHGRPAVTNAQVLDALAATGADVRADARVVDDGDVLTAGGPMAGVDLAIRLVERSLGAEAAAGAARRLEHERRGPLLVPSGAAA